MAAVLSDGTTKKWLQTSSNVCWGRKKISPWLRTTYNARSILAVTEHLCVSLQISVPEPSRMLNNTFPNSGFQDIAARVSSRGVKKRARRLILCPRQNDMLSPGPASFYYVVNDPNFSAVNICIICSFFCLALVI
jgi:hypothetical protein